MTRFIGLHVNPHTLGTPPSHGFWAESCDVEDLNPEVDPLLAAHITMERNTEDTIVMTVDGAKRVIRVLQQMVDGAVVVYEGTEHIGRD